MRHGGLDQRLCFGGGLGGLDDHDDLGGGDVNAGVRVGIEVLAVGVLEDPIYDLVRRIVDLQFHVDPAGAEHHFRNLGQIVDREDDNDVLGRIVEEVHDILEGEITIARFPGISGVDGDLGLFGLLTRGEDIGPINVVEHEDGFGTDVANDSFEHSEFHLLEGHFEDSALIFLRQIRTDGCLAGSRGSVKKNGLFHDTPNFGLC